MDMKRAESIRSESSSIQQERIRRSVVDMSETPMLLMIKICARTSTNTNDVESENERKILKKKDRSWNK
jgi:hypothetical protein